MCISYFDIVIYFFTLALRLVDWSVLDFKEVGLKYSSCLICG